MNLRVALLLHSHSQMRLEWQVNADVIHRATCHVASIARSDQKYDLQATPPWAITARRHDDARRRKPQKQRRKSMAAVAAAAEDDCSSQELTGWEVGSISRCYIKRKK